MSRDARSVRRNTASINRNVGTISSGTARARNDINRVGASASRSSGLIRTSIGDLARFAGPVALGAAAAATINAASTMETALEGIRKKSGATTEEMANIREEVKALAGEVPASMGEILAAYERGAASGIPLGELREFAKLSTSVAASWDTSAEKVGNFFAGFESGLGLKRTEQEEYADLINGLADAGISDEVDIAAFVDRAGAGLTNFGMTPQEIAAWGSALIDLKMPAEIAARAMDTITGKLLAPENLSDKAASGLQNIVGDLKEFSKIQGGERAITFFKELNKLSGQQQASFLGAFLGEGFDDEAARIGKGFEKVLAALAFSKDKSNYVGSIAEATERQMDLWETQVSRLQTSFGNIGESIGELFINPLGTGLDMLTEFNNQLADEIASKSTVDDARSEYVTRYGEDDLAARVDKERTQRGDYSVFDRLYKRQAIIAEIMKAWATGGYKGDPVAAYYASKDAATAKDARVANPYEPGPTGHHPGTGTGAPLPVVEVTTPTARGDISGAGVRVPDGLKDITTNADNGVGTDLADNYAEYGDGTSPAARRAAASDNFAANMGAGAASLANRIQAVMNVDTREAATAISGIHSQASAPVVVPITADTSAFDAALADAKRRAQGAGVAVKVGGKGRLTTGAPSKSTPNAGQAGTPG